MEEDIMETPDTDRDPEWKYKKPTSHCVINIFCDDSHGWGQDPDKDDGNCVINIFCGDKHVCDHIGKDDGNCVINIFCGDKKHLKPCDDKKPVCKW
jgi:hypothetical protein